MKNDIRLAVAAIIVLAVAVGLVPDRQPADRQPADREVEDVLRTNTSLLKDANALLRAAVLEERRTTLLTVEE